MSLLDGTDIVQGNTIEELQGKVYRNRGYGKSEIDLFDVMKGHFLHQASFCRKELFKIYGMYDESYRIAGDTKFFMNCFVCKDATFRYVDLDIANYDVSGISAQNSSLQKKELDRIYQELFSNRLLSFYYENDKKIRFYNRLRRHKWIWFFTMIVSRLELMIYKVENITKKERL